MSNKEIKKRKINEIESNEVENNNNNNNNNDLELIINEKNEEIKNMKNLISNLFEILNEGQNYHKNIYLDPNINLEYELMKESLIYVKKSEQNALDLINSDKFQNDSITGRNMLTRIQILEKKNKLLNDQILKYKNESNTIDELNESNSNKNDQINLLKKEIEDKNEEIYNLKLENEDLNSKLQMK